MISGREFAIGDLGGALLSRTLLERLGLSGRGPEILNRSSLRRFGATHELIKRSTPDRKHDDPVLAVDRLDKAQRERLPLAEQALRPDDDSLGRLGINRVNEPHIFPVERQNPVASDEPGGRNARATVQRSLHVEATLCGA
jgi:hypothetical protein